MLALDERIEKTEDKWADATLDSVIQHLLRDHRAWRVKDFPTIESLFDRVADTNGSGRPSCLVSLRRAFYRLRAEMEGHMSQEENVLFPAILAAERQTEAGPARHPFQEPIAALVHDHDEDDQLLATIRDAAQGYQLPETADANLRILFRELQALEAAMHAHSRLESSILFARALRESA